METIVRYKQIIIDLEDEVRQLHKQRSALVGALGACTKATCREQVSLIVEDALAKLGADKTGEV